MFAEQRSLKLKLGESGEEDSGLKEKFQPDEEEDDAVLDTGEVK